MKPRTVLFFGASGAGKGTQAKLLVKKIEEFKDGNRVLYIETGAKFREFMEQANPTSKRVKELLNEGKFLPAFLPIWLWSDILVKNLDGTEHLVLDGLSRRVSEAPVLDSALRFYDRPYVDVVNINVSREWSKNRLLARGRFDDNKKDIEERLNEFETLLLPTIDFYRNKPDYYHFHEVNGEQGIEEVAAEINKAVFNE